MEREVYKIIDILDEMIEIGDFPEEELKSVFQDDVGEVTTDEYTEWADKISKLIEEVEQITYNMKDEV